jgi:hypothetical protein
MIAVGVDITGIAGLTDAISRGRAAAMRLQAEWVAARIRENIAAQRDPWGRGWRPKSRNSDGGPGPALSGYGSRIRPVWTATSWDVLIDDEHASSHQFGRAKIKRGNRARSTARRALATARTADRLGRREARRGDTEAAAFLAGRAAEERATAATAYGSTARSGEPPRAMLPLRVRNSGRQEPVVDFPEEWTRELDAIMDREVQREINALRAPMSATAASAA